MVKNSEELLNKIEEIGVENIRFIVPMRPIIDYGFVRFTSSSDKPVKVECKINEERFKVKDKYKITLESVEPGFGKDHFYVLDLVQLMRDDYITIKN